MPRTSTRPSRPKRSGAHPPTTPAPASIAEDQAIDAAMDDDLRTVVNRIIPVEAIRPHPRNYNRHPEAQLLRLEASDARFGQVRSIVVQEGAPGVFVLCAGEGYLTARRRRGKQFVKADVIPANWTPQQVEGYLVADNELAHGSEPDSEMLAHLLEEQSAAGMDLATMGYSDGELRDLLDRLADAHLGGGFGERDEDALGDAHDPADPDGGGDDFDATPDVGGPARVQLGDLWQLGAHRLLCGDSTQAAEVARLMAGDRAPLMWTDPPYGISYVGKTKRALTIQNDGADDLAQLLQRAFGAADDEALLEGAAIYIASPSGKQGLTFIDCFNARWPLRQTLIWVKDSLVLGHSDYHYRHETILYGYKPGGSRRGRGADGWYGDNAQTSVFEFPRPKRSDEHPTMKPVPLVAAMLANSSPKGGLVYEPFCGSGSTVIASERLRRRCRAVEIDPVYCDVVLRRWEQESGREATLLHRLAS